MAKNLVPNCPASSFRHEFNKLDEGHHFGNDLFPCGVMGAT
jgi:hypothetical protein